MSAATLPILLRSLGLTTMAREHDDALARAEAEHWGSDLSKRPRSW